jgi:hypothetical protein
MFQLENCSPKFLDWLKTTQLWKLHQTDNKLLWVSYFEFAYDAWLAKHSLKYARDCGIRKELGKFVDELRTLIDQGKDGNALSDYLDEEFLFGAWGHICDKLDPLFLKDVRGFIIAMYSKPKETA